MLAEPTYPSVTAPDSVTGMPFKLGGSTRRTWSAPEDESLPEEQPTEPRTQVGPLTMEQPLWPRTIPEPHEVDRLFAQVFALVGEGIAGATHALLAGDRDAAKELVKRDEVIDKLIHQISSSVQLQLVEGETTTDERREYVAILRMLPDMERNGDLAEHIRAPRRTGPRGRDVGAQPRSRRAHG